MTGQRGRRRLVPAATLVLLVLGTATLTLALALALVSGGDDDAGPGSSAPPGAEPAAPAGVDPDETSGSASGDPAGRRVAELVDPEWVAATAEATDVPARALAAYAGASIAVSTSHPSCGLGWNTLAAIGHVESEHGRIGGAALGPGGDVSPPIFGVPLDGDGVAEIPDTDRGRLDEDRRWDRAVGPMQFIPATWQAHASDGDGDGTPDVHDIDDAALTAATYLCSAGGDLTRPDSWIAAISAYNRGADYNGRVAASAARYAAASASGG